MCEPTNQTSKTNHSQVHQDWSRSPNPLPSHIKAPYSPPGLSDSPLQVQGSTETSYASPPVQFCCSDCPRTTARKRELRHHILRCHFPQQTEQKCALCPGSFNSFSVLRLHYERAHPASPPPPGVLFLCDLCSAAYTCETGLRYHVVRTHPAHMSCILCLCRTDGRPNQVFTYMPELKRHYETHRFNTEGVHIFCLLVCRLATDKVRNITDVGEHYTCDICQQMAFRTKLELRDHILASHYNLRRFFCRYCTHFAGSKEEIWKHNSSKHGARDVKAFGEVSDIAECLELFETENWEHKRFETFVGSRFCDHMTAVHGITGKYKNIVRKEECKRRFSSNTELLKHFSEHHPGNMACGMCHEKIIDGFVYSAKPQAAKELVGGTQAQETTKSLFEDNRLKNVKQEEMVVTNGETETLILNIRRKNLEQRYRKHLEHCSTLANANSQIRTHEPMCSHCCKTLTDQIRLARLILSLHLCMSSSQCALCGQQFYLQVDLGQHWQSAHGLVIPNMVREKPGGNVIDAETYENTLNCELPLQLDSKGKQTEKFQCVSCSVYFNSTSGTKKKYTGTSSITPNHALSDSRDITEHRYSRTYSVRRKPEFVDCSEIPKEKKAKLQQFEFVNVESFESPECFNNQDFPREPENSSRSCIPADHISSTSHLNMSKPNQDLTSGENDIPIPSSSSDPSRNVWKAVPEYSSSNPLSGLVISLPNPVAKTSDVPLVSTVTDTPSNNSIGISEHKVNIVLLKFQVSNKDMRKKDSLKLDTYRYKEAFELIQDIKRNEDKTYSCYICLQKFQDIPKIKYHILKTHLDLGRYSCAYCVFVDYSIVEVARHTIQTHPGFRLVCRIRIDTTKEPAPIAKGQPLQMNHPCKFCKMRFGSKSSLRLHVEKEHLCVESQPLPCTMHEYIMNTLQNHYEIQYSHRITEISETPRCNAEYCSISELRMHIDAHHESKCEYCGSDVFQEAGEDTIEICLSMWKLENMVETLTPVRIKDGFYNCPLCSSLFRYYKKFRSHVLGVHFELKNYKCSDCCFLGYNYRIFTSHIQKQHKGKHNVTVLRVLGKAPYLSEQENFKSYTCSSCQSKFHTIGELRGHMASHSAEDCEPRDCDVLGKFSLQPQNPESANQNQVTAESANQNQVTAESANQNLVTVKQEEPVTCSALDVTEDVMKNSQSRFDVADCSVNQIFEPKYLSSFDERFENCRYGETLHPIKTERDSEDFVACKYEMDLDQIKVEDVPLCEETFAEFETTFVDNPTTSTDVATTLSELRTTFPKARTTSSEVSLTTLASGNSNSGASMRKQRGHRVTSRPYPDLLPPVPGGCLPCSVQL